MSDYGTQGLGDLLGLLGGSNPLAGIGRSVEQFKRGVNDFLKAVENFNDTMEQLNGVAKRVNGLLDEVEEPIKTFMPQVTRTLKAADTMVEQLSGPVEKVAPGINRLADTLSSPTMVRLPNDLGNVVEGLSDLVRKLQPLTRSPSPPARCSASVRSPHSVRAAAARTRGDADRRRAHEEARSRGDRAGDNPPRSHPPRGPQGRRHRPRRPRPRRARPRRHRPRRLRQEGSRQEDRCHEEVTTVSSARLSTVLTLAFLSICVAGAVAGWKVVGDAFISQLQVGDDEYVAMLELSPWAGAFVGLVAALLVGVAMWAVAALAVWVARRP